jgi:hypothetical protein
MSQDGQPSPDIRFLGSATNELGRIASGVERQCSDLATARAAARSTVGDPIIVTLDDVHMARKAALEETLGRPERWHRALKTACSVVGGIVVGAAITIAATPNPSIQPLWTLLIGVIGTIMIAISVFIEWRWA